MTNIVSDAASPGKSTKAPAPKEQAMSQPYVVPAPPASEPVPDGTWEERTAPFPPPFDVAGWAKAEVSAILADLEVNSPIEHHPTPAVHCARPVTLPALDGVFLDLTVPCLEKPSHDGLCVPHLPDGGVKPRQVEKIAVTPEPKAGDASAASKPSPRPRAPRKPKPAVDRPTSDKAAAS